MSTKTHERRRIDTRLQTAAWIAERGQPELTPITERKPSKEDIARFKKRTHLQRRL